MSRRLLLACLFVAGLSPVAVGQMLNTSRPLPTRAALGRLGLERFWFAAVPMLPGTEQVIHLSMTEDLLFAQTSHAELHAFEAETGRLVWTASLGSETGQAKDVAVNSKYVFATNASDLHALDRGTGRFVWRKLLPAPAASGVTATEDEVLVGLTSGQVVAYGLNYKGTDERFRPKEGPPGGFHWAWSTTGPIIAKPITSPYVVVFASSGGKLYGARMDQPEILHRSQQLGGIVASMGTYGSGPASSLYVPSLDNNLYAINLFTGEHQWAFPSGAPIRTQPLVADIIQPVGAAGAAGGRAPKAALNLPIAVERINPVAYVLNELGILHAVDLATGTGIWGPDGARCGAETVLAIGASKIYLQSEFGDLVIVDRATGAIIAGPAASRERAGLDLRDYKLALSNDENDRVYLCTPFGSLLGIRELGITKPVPQRDSAEPVFGYLERDVVDEPVDTPPPSDVPAFRENADDPTLDNPGDIP